MERCLLDVRSARAREATTKQGWSGWTILSWGRCLAVFTEVITVSHRITIRQTQLIRIGERPAYPIEVFAILEEHSDFEQVGFHWHLLVKGVDFLPNQVVSDALRSATGGRSYITKTERVRNNKAIGYVTKYLMKEITRERRGMVEEQVKRLVLSVDDGKLVQEEVLVTVEEVSSQF